MNYHQRKYLSSFMLASTAFGALLLCNPSPGLAVPLLGSDLASFAVLGASTVTNIPTSTVVGNVGVYAGTSISGFNSSPGVAVADPQVTGGLVHATDAVAQNAQNQLTIARAGLTSMGAGTLLGADLAGQSLSPGVYTVPAGISNLTGTLILNGGGNANAGWVFQMPSTFITSPNSVVNLINTGAGAGVFWNVGSSATLDTTTKFKGNILALTSITLNTSATIGCGSALANTGAVTMDHNTIGNGCGLGGVGSNGFRLSGGLRVPEGGGVPVFLASVGDVVGAPEPTSLLLIGTGLAGLVFAVWQRKPSADRHAVDEVPA